VAAFYLYYHEDAIPPFAVIGYGGFLSIYKGEDNILKGGKVLLF